MSVYTINVIKVGNNWWLSTWERNFSSKEFGACTEIYFTIKIGTTRNHFSRTPSACATEVNRYQYPWGLLDWTSLTKSPVLATRCHWGRQNKGQTRVTFLLRFNASWVMDTWRFHCYILILLVSLSIPHPTLPFYPYSPNPSFHHTPLSPHTPAQVHAGIHTPMDRMTDRCEKLPFRNVVCGR